MFVGCWLWVCLLFIKLILRDFGFACTSVVWVNSFVVFVGLYLIILWFTGYCGRLECGVFGYCLGVHFGTMFAGLVVCLCFFGFTDRGGFLLCFGVA